ncbi:MAG TPA: type II toxin-antitoxin system RelE/ParE family toxin [Pirellulales bacterium]|nr:type II toxin-antitoxin system RelE/ParE family toxin [Pirellulales bacterium]
MKHVVVRARALADLESLAAFFHATSDELAARFLDAANRTFDFLLNHPQLGRRSNLAHHRLTNIRIWHVDGFPNHLVFYEPKNDTIEIVRVLHGSRDLDAALGES